MKSNTDNLIDKLKILEEREFNKLNNKRVLTDKRIYKHIANHKLIKKLWKIN